MLPQGRGSWGAKRRLTTGASLPCHHENLGSFLYLSRWRPRPPPGGLERGSRAGGGQGCSAQACHGLNFGTGPSFQLASVPPCQGHGEAGRPDEAPGPSCLSFERSWDTEARHLGAAPGPWAPALLTQPCGLQSAAQKGAPAAQDTDIRWWAGLTLLCLDSQHPRPRPCGRHRCPLGMKTHVTETQGGWRPAVLIAPQHGHRVQQDTEDSSPAVHGPLWSEGRRQWPGSLSTV